jgi:hypothetical protein
MVINIIAGIMVKKQSTSRKKINSFVWVFMFLSLREEVGGVGDRRAGA